VSRALLVALACLFAAEAQARVGVVVTSPNGTEGRVQESVVSMMLTRMGVDFDVISPFVAKTLFCQTGDQVYDFGASTAYVKHYDVFMHLNQTFNTGSNPAGYQPDSLTLTVKLPTIPNIFVGRHSGENSFQTSTSESSGVAFDGEAYGGTNAEDYGYTNYLVGTPYRWKTPGFQRATVDTGTIFDAGGAYVDRVVPGGFRPLVACSMTPANDQVANDADSLYNEITGAGGSVSQVATADTLVAWVRQNKHKSDSAHNIFVLPGGAVAVCDPSLIAIALNYADSLTNGKVFENRRMLPLKAGIHIDDGWRRSGRASSGGIYEPDTTQLKAGIDSLASLKVPFVVGVAVDSMRALANIDSTWWERARPYVRYTLHSHNGLVNPSTSRDASITADGLLDIHGAGRSRKMYNGEECAATDTTLYCLLREAFARLERSFPGRVDHVLMPPTDDWTPPSITKVNAGPGLDSLFWMMRRAGARGVRANGASTTTIMFDVGYQTNPQRYPLYRTPGTPSDGLSGYFPILMTNGYIADGATTWNSWATMAALFLNGFFTGLDQAVLDWGPEIPGSSQIGEKVIIAAHVNDLAGISTDNAPKHPGWHYIKYIVNKFKAINAVGLPSRKVLEIAYPQDVAQANNR